MGEPARRTKIIDHCANPYWKEDFIYRVKDQRVRASEIKFDVLHTNGMFEYPIGTVSVGLSQLDDAMTYQRWLPLKGVKSGEINVAMIFFPAAPPTTKEQWQAGLDEAVASFCFYEEKFKSIPKFPWNIFLKHNSSFHKKNRKYTTEKTRVPQNPVALSVFGYGECTVPGTYKNSKKKLVHTVATYGADGAHGRSGHSGMSGHSGSCGGRGGDGSAGGHGHPGAHGAHARPIAETIITKTPYQQDGSFHVSLAGMPHVEDVHMGMSPNYDSGVFFDAHGGAGGNGGDGGRGGDGGNGGDGHRGHDGGSDGFNGYDGGRGGDGGNGGDGGRGGDGADGGRGGNAASVTLTTKNPENLMIFHGGNVRGGRGGSGGVGGSGGSGGSGGWGGSGGSGGPAGSRTESHQVRDADGNSRTEVTTVYGTSGMSGSSGNSGSSGYSGSSGSSGCRGADGQGAVITFHITDAMGNIMETTQVLYNLRVLEYDIVEGKNFLVLFLFSLKN